MNHHISRGRLKRYGPLAAWVALIFFFSSGEASAEQTSRIIRPILEFVFPTASEEILVNYHGYIRKLAHFVEYAVLGFFTVRALSNSSRATVRKWRFLAASIFIVLIASLDEINQSFQPTRTSSTWDMALDTLGGLSAIGSMKAIQSRRRRGR